MSSTILETPLDRRNPREGILAVTVLKRENIPAAWDGPGSKYVLDLAYEGFCTPLTPLNNLTNEEGKPILYGALPVGSYYGGADIEIRVRKRGDPRKKTVVSRAPITMSRLVSYQRTQMQLLLREDSLKKNQSTKDGPANANSETNPQIYCNPPQSACGFRNLFYKEMVLEDISNPARKYTVVLEYIGGFAAEKIGDLGMNMLHRFAAEGQFGMIFYAAKVMKKEDLCRYIKQTTQDGRYPLEVAAQDIAPDAQKEPLDCLMNRSYVNDDGQLVHDETREMLGLTPNSLTNISTRKSALHYACEGGCYDTVRMFALSAEDFNILTNEAYSPVAVASQQNNVALLDKIFSRYTGVSDYLRTNMQGHHHPLLVACERGHVDVIDLLAGYCPHTVSDTLGKSPFHRAALGAEEELTLQAFKTLIEKGFSPDLKDTASRSCLHELTKNGYSSVVTYLSSHLSAFSVLSPDEWFNIPLYTAKLCGEILQCFNQFKEGETENVSSEDPRSLGLCFTVVVTLLSSEENRVSINEPYSDVITALRRVFRQEEYRPVKAEKSFILITQRLENIVAPETSWMRDYIWVKKSVIEQLVNKYNTLDFFRVSPEKARKENLSNVCGTLKSFANAIKCSELGDTVLHRQASSELMEEDSDQYEFLDASSVEEPLDKEEFVPDDSSGNVLTPFSRQKKAEAMYESELNEKIEKLVREVAKVVNAPIGKVVAALRQNSWRVDETVNSLMEDSSLHLSNGNGDMLSAEEHSHVEEMECMTCLDDVPPSRMFHAGCKHFMCDNCWKDHLHTCVKEFGGSVVFHSQCPMHGCNTKVPEDLWKRMASEEDRHEYEKWLIRQYVNASPDIVLCPASHCRRPVKHTGGRTDIVCPFCGQFFCARCEGEAHSPATCQEVELWYEEKRFFTDEATERYVMRNFKKCPQCHTFIERTQGCNHMKCAHCNFEYCYMCKRPWSEHGGGFFHCKFYEQEIKDKKKTENIVEWENYTEEEKQRAQEEINSQRQREFEVTNAAFQQQQDGMDRCRELLQIFNEQNEALKKAEDKAQNELSSASTNLQQSSNGQEGLQSLNDVEELDAPPLSLDSPKERNSIDPALDEHIRTIFDEWQEAEMLRFMQAGEESLERAAHISGLICDNRALTKAGETDGRANFFTALTPLSPYAEFQFRPEVQGSLCLDQSKTNSMSNNGIIFASNGQISCRNLRNTDPSWSWNSDSPKVGLGILFDNEAYPLPIAKCYLLTINGREVARIAAECVAPTDTSEETMYSDFIKRIRDMPATRMTESLGQPPGYSVGEYRDRLITRIRDLSFQQPCCPFVKLVLTSERASATVDLVVGLPSFVNFDWNTNLTRLHTSETEHVRSLRSSLNLLQSLLERAGQLRSNSSAGDPDGQSAKDEERQKELEKFAKEHYDEIIAGGLDALPVRRKQREKCFSVIEQSLRVLAEFHHVYKWTWVHTFYMTSQSASKQSPASAAAAAAGSHAKYSEDNRKQAVESSLQQLEEIAQILFDEVKPTGNILRTKIQNLQHLARLTQDRYNKLILDFEAYSAEMGESEMVKQLKKQKH